MILDRKMDNENLVHLHNRVLHAEKNNDSLNFAGKWKELENIILSEVTQTQKDNYHKYSRVGGFFFNIKQRKPAYKRRSQRI